MASETVYIVQSYVRGRGKGLKAEQQVGCKTAEEARRKAERLGPLRVGVVAFSATADTELGDYDENPVILSGQANFHTRLPKPDLCRAVRQAEALGLRHQHRHRL